MYKNPKGTTEPAVLTTNWSPLPLITGNASVTMSFDVDERGVATDIRIVEAVCSFESVPFRAPLKFGGRIVDKTTLINVEVSVGSRRGHGASGFGSMPVGNVWAWPSASVSAEQTEDAMKKFAEEVIELANGFPDFGHPIEIAYQISAEYPHLAKTLTLRSLPEIGRRFGGRDHTTVLHAVRKSEALVARDTALSEEVESLKRQLQE